jgi:hypothetical protein
MTYSKPEITVLGDAAETIQSFSKSINPTDGVDAAPAYDLDE